MFQDGVKKTISSDLSRYLSPAGTERINSQAQTFPPPNQARTTLDTAPQPQARLGKYDTAGHWFPSLPFQQFQVLFNSLFKVLCIFPSRYLCAIGLPPIFSFRWNLPPTLSCNPKQLDSLTTWPTHKGPADGSLTLSCCPVPRDLAGPAGNTVYRPQLGIQKDADSHLSSSRFSRPY